MLVDEIKVQIESKLKKQTISSRVLLDKLRLIDSYSRKSSQYQDPNYLPFYYYLGKFIFPKSILHVGFNLGLPLCCFMQSCSVVERVLCFQRKSKEYYSSKLGLSNVKDIKGKNFNVDFYYGDLFDLECIAKIKIGFDMILITEKLNNDQINETLDMCWENLNFDGILVVDYINSNKHVGEIFKGFSKGKNRNFEIFNTRYGTGVLQK
jgi:hypothetical protein